MHMECFLSARAATQVSTAQAVWGQVQDSDRHGYLITPKLEFEATEGKLF